ncbi:dihydrofolate reductase [Nocardioides mangrovicus]|uniref:Dihydrofolate reductase n=1 Tax=Nocardioides mangrovicus TaxID=2478913 RepID=A0A3L8P0Q8_9ACTN|nr:dihydrofolate reductase family protein [Nocardioides mangrovicus]RLV48179.1 dihydrofolate reductase [Nocardioides mangrovicus]
MRPLVVTQNMSLDGSIEFLGDWFDPSDSDEQLAAQMREFTAREEAMLLGRQTFEDFRGYWPQQTDDTTGTAEALDRVQKYVVSATLGDPEWQNSTVLGADWLERVRELKAGGDGEICLTGSIRLCHAVLEAGLVDEIRLVIYPVVQGRGRRLFPDGYETSALRPLESRVFDNGVVLLRHAVG